MQHFPVLVVDDELAVRRAMSRVLRQHGFEVIEAATVQEACGALEMLPELCMLITDNRIVDGSGRDLHRHLGATVEDRSGLFLVMTGSDFDCVDMVGYRDYFSSHNVRVLRKPFGIKEELLPILQQFCQGRWA